MLTHDQIYERLYPIWQNLPGSNAKVKLGGLIADLEAETLEAEPLAVVEGEAARIPPTTRRRFRAVVYFDCEEESRLRFPVTVTITARDGGKHEE